VVWCAALRVRWYVCSVGVRKDATGPSSREGDVRPTWSGE
jgi:hypothetical protein